MADYYEIRLYNTAAVQQIVLQKWIRLAFTQRLDDAWSHQIFFDLSSEDSYCDFLRNEVDVDWLVRIIRYDPLNTRSEQVVYTGFNRTIVEQGTHEGNIQFAMYGSGLTDLVRRRIVLPDTGLEASEKTGPAETVIKAFVDESCVSAIDTDRNFPGLTIEVDAATGATATYSARYTQLLTVLTRLSEQGGLHFGIDETLDSSGNPTPGQFTFRVAPVWGLDRRQGNTAGNVPTVFSMGFGNMTIPIFSRNESETRNYIYAGGSGQGTDRLIRASGDTTDIARSPWNRHEGFLNAAQEKSNAGLDTRITAELEKGVPRATLNFTLNETEGSRWLVSWGLGDLVTAEYFGNTFEKLLTAINVEVTSGRGERREVVTALMETL